MTLKQLARAVFADLRQRRVESAKLIGAGNDAIASALTFSAGEIAALERVMAMISDVREQRGGA